MNSQMTKSTTYERRCAKMYDLMNDKKNDVTPKSTISQAQQKINEERF